MSAKTVLLVDDAAFMRKVLSTMLTAEGYTVVGEAPNGLIGMEMYKELKPNLAILDITMEVMDGIEATRGIREYDPNANIIVCSAMLGQSLMIAEALKAGARDCIKKPFQKEQVLEKVSKAFENIG